MIFKQKQKIKLWLICVFVFWFFVSYTYGKEESLCCSWGSCVPYKYRYWDVNEISTCMIKVDVNNFSIWDQQVINYSTKDFLENFCSTLLSESPAYWRIYYSMPAENWEVDHRETKDSQKSLFVYALCSSFKKDEEMPFIPEMFGSKNDSVKEGFTKKDIVSVLKLRQMAKEGDTLVDKCSLEENVSLSDCDLTVYATEIFSALMSEIFKIKYAEVFNVKSKETKKQIIEGNVVNFMTWYFGLEPDYKAIQNRFPQVVSLLQTNQQFFIKRLQTLKLIDNEKLQKEADQCWKVYGENREMSWVEFLTCAMHWENWKWSWLDSTFLTFYYNEVLNYRVFLTYYLYWLKLKGEKDNTLTTFQKNKILALQEAMDSRVNLQLAAGQQTLYDYEDLIYTYPLHIELLMYLESLKNFRDNHLSPVVTLFYSLSEKLQNVQTTD